MPEPPHITILDASTMTRGDLDLSVLERFGTLTSHDRTRPEEVVTRSLGAEILLTNKVILDGETIAQLPGLNLIQIMATGTNNVDLAAAREAGIDVCNVAGYSVPGVTQHVIAFILNLATSQPELLAERAAWAQSPIFTRLQHPVFEVEGKILGIVGAGDIGTAVGRVAEALGMNILCLQSAANPKQKHTPEGWLRVSKDELLARSDFVTLHCPLTDQTRHFMDATALRAMKPDAFLINTGRGPLVDEAALAEALRNGAIAGAALDVLSTEPPPADHPLLHLDHPKLLITPHTAWASLESRKRLLKGIVSNLEGFLGGNPANLVNTGPS